VLSARVEHFRINRWTLFLIEKGWVLGERGGKGRFLATFL